MKRRELLKSLPYLLPPPGLRKSGPDCATAHTPPSYKGRLRPGVVAMSFRPQLESGKMTYEDAVRYIADLGLEGMDMTSYWVPPLLPFQAGHQVSGDFRDW